MLTVGVSLAVPDPWATWLREYRARLGDPTAERVPAHITLVPPVEVPESRCPEVETRLAEVAARQPAFGLHLKGAGTFRPVSPVVFLQVARGIPGCEQLEAATRRGLLHTELRFPYHPHVTVAHHLPEAVLDRAYEELADFEARFTVGRFHLYVHHEQRGWVPRNSFELQQTEEESGG